MFSYLKYSFVFVFLIFSNAHAMLSPIDDASVLIDLIENTKFENVKEVTEEHEFSVLSSPKPLGLCFQKSQKILSSSSPYEEIYRFIIATPSDLKNHSLFFKDFQTLRQKNKALLVIDFPSNWTTPFGLKLQMTLPAMDTVINGDVNGAQIWIDKANNKNANSYFFLSTQSQKVTVRAAGQVFAKKPSMFAFMEAGFSIKELPENIYRRFIIKNTFSDGTIKPDILRYPPARRHQISQLVDYAQARLKGVKYMTFEAATGSGKTRTMYYLLSELLNKDQKALIVTSRLNLISQIRNSFEEESQRGEKNLVVGSTNDKDFSLEKITKYDILLTTIQGFQLTENYEKLMPMFDIIIFDEAHNLFSTKRLNVVNRLKTSSPKNPQLLFFTATPNKSDRHESGLLSVYELSDDLANHNIRPYGILAAIDDNVNAPFQIALVKSPEFVSENHHLFVKGGDFNKKSVAESLAFRAINDIVFDIYKNGQINNKPLSKRKSIAFCSSIRRAEELAAFLNKKNVDDKEAEKEYEINVNHYFGSLSLKPNKLPPEFNDIWRTVYGRVSNNLSKAAIKEFSKSFIKKYHYVFADAVHAGNKKFVMSSDDGQARLLRYRLGGANILCGADKLTEGFDDPKLEIAFFLTPTKSKTKVMQRFGRILRTNPEDKEKIAIGFDFLFDDRQLLISSQNAAGHISYGLKDPISITVDKKTKRNYEIATENFYAGTEAVKEKRSLASTSGDHEKKRNQEKPKKKRKTNVQTDNLLDQMKLQIAALKLMAENLNKYTLVVPKCLDLTNILDAPVDTSHAQRSLNTSHKAGFDMMPDEADDAIKALKEAMKPVYDFFSNAPASNDFWANFSDFPRMTKSDRDDEDGLNLYLKNIIEHAQNVLRRADSFVTNCQMTGSQTKSVEKTTVKGIDDLIDEAWEKENDDAAINDQVEENSSFMFDNLFNSDVQQSMFNFELTDAGSNISNRQNALGSALEKPIKLSSEEELLDAAFRETETPEITNPEIFSGTPESIFKTRKDLEKDLMTLRNSHQTYPVYRHKEGQLPKDTCLQKGSTFLEEKTETTKKKNFPSNKRATFINKSFRPIKPYLLDKKLNFTNQSSRSYEESRLPRNKLKFIDESKKISLEMSRPVMTPPPITPPPVVGIFLPFVGASGISDGIFVPNYTSNNISSSSNTISVIDPSGQEVCYIIPDKFQAPQYFYSKQ